VRLQEWINGLNGVRAVPRVIPNGPRVRLTPNPGV
jgi:hypothetical protein